MPYTISTERELLDVDWIHAYLSNTAYWSKGRTKKEVEESIKNSFCVGVFKEDGTQIGFGRVVTDYVVFAWIMDVFVDEAYRGMGVGKMLVNFIVDHPELSQVNGMGLKTQDAHQLYHQFGFKTVDDPEIWMFKKNK